MSARDVTDADYDPLQALRECHNLWASGAWPDENAVYNLEEVMQHVYSLLNRGTTMSYLDMVRSFTNDPDVHAAAAGLDKRLHEH